MPGTVMAQEMAEQPAVLARLAERRTEILEEVRGMVPDPLAGIVLVARGSSDHAATFGRYAFELASGRPVSLSAPSIHTLYRARVDYRGYLAVGVSQSGRTPEIVSVMQACRSGGARTVAITNDPDSPLALAAEFALDLGAGRERALPATKTFTAQLAAFAMLAEVLGPVPWDEDDWARLPEAVAAVLADPGPASGVAAEIDDAPGLITVGRGFLFAAALEAALKLKETALMLAEGYSAADLLHGPIAVVEQGFPVIAFWADGPAAPAMEDLREQLLRRGGRVFVVGPPGSDLPFVLPVAEALSSIPAAVRAQQIAHALALSRGLDPDAPRGLSKVTMTR